MRQICRSVPSLPSTSVVGSDSPNEVSNVAPQISQILPCSGVNEARHASQIGTRLARVRRPSHSRQPAGNRMLTTASPASANQRRPCFAESCGCATRTEVYLYPLYKQRVILLLRYSRSEVSRCAENASASPTPAYSSP